MRVRKGKRREDERERERGYDHDLVYVEQADQ